MSPSMKIHLEKNFMHTF